MPDTEDYKLPITTVEEKSKETLSASAYRQGRDAVRVSRAVRPNLKEEP